jgi:hypothetical protein
MAGATAAEAEAALALAAAAGGIAVDMCGFRFEGAEERPPRNCSRSATERRRRTVPCVAIGDHEPGVAPHMTFMSYDIRVS